MLGYLNLVLHAHLPFVRHPEYEDFFEEDWFYEAVAETYVPLLQIYEALVKEGVDFRITMSISPTLSAMFEDKLLQDRCLARIERLIDLCRKELVRTQFQPEFNKLAQWYLGRFTTVRDTYLRYGRNLNHGFRHFQDTGVLELITVGATHGFLPLLSVNPECVRAQIGVAVQSYKRVFERAPRGIWLPECAYMPGHDEFLKEFGIRYFFVDTHGLLFAKPRPRYSVYAPVYCQSGVAAFGRDVESSKQVWSAKEGYPGDYNYREFYRDVGWDLEYDYIKPYLHKDGKRCFVGIKYYRITGPTEHKEPYVPENALAKAAEHAGHFMWCREKQVEYLASLMDRKPVVVAPYDAELYGHWWHEGVDFLYFLFKKIHYDQETIKTITPSEYLKEYPENQVVDVNFSSWGWKGYCEVWLNGSNDWIYRHLHKAGERMVELARKYPDAQGILRRALNQSARELLLAESSDWPFIMHTGTDVEYAVKRFREHIINFTKLYHQILDGKIDEAFLADLEYRHNLFPDIDYQIYR